MVWVQTQALLGSSIYLHGAVPQEAPTRDPASLELSILAQMRSVSTGSSKGLVERTCNARLLEAAQLGAAAWCVLGRGPGGGAVLNMYFAHDQVVKSGLEALVVGGLFLLDTF